MTTTDAIKKSMVDVENILRQYPDLAGVTPFPVNSLAIRLGYKIVYTAPNLSAMESSFSGGVSINDKIIYVNISNSRQRMLFTTAHEIGHVVLHADKIEKTPLYDPSITYDIAGQMDFQRSIAAGGYNEIEHEANAFAGELLMPFRTFKKEYESYKEQLSNDGLLYHLSAKFGTSRQATIYRVDLVTRHGDEI